jgi:hypothetical protein
VKENTYYYCKRTEKIPHGTPPRRPRVGRHGRTTPTHRRHPPPPSPIAAPPLEPAAGCLRGSQGRRRRGSLFSSTFAWPARLLEAVDGAATGWASAAPTRPDPVLPPPDPVATVPDLLPTGHLLWWPFPHLSHLPLLLSPLFSFFLLLLPWQGADGAAALPARLGASRLTSLRSRLVYGVGACSRDACFACRGCCGSGDARSCHQRPGSSDLRVGLPGVSSAAPWWHGRRWLVRMRTFCIVVVWLAATERSPGVCFCCAVLPR